MQSVSKKDSDQTIDFGSGSSGWFTTEQLQLSLSKSVAATGMEREAEHHYYMKQSESPYQKQDSSSSLSTEQSHYDDIARNTSNMQKLSFQSGTFKTQKKNEEVCKKPCPPCGKADYINHPLQMEHNLSLGYTSYPFAESYFGQMMSAYGPNAVIYPQMVGVTPTRVVLPLDCTEGIPIYVNAKQYHAILRRRQTRAKLMVQQKMAKSRKPYLHESRHLHALKRARGSGGRFLNTKTVQQPDPPAQTHNKNFYSHERIGNASKVEIQPSESNSWGASTPTGSDVSCIFNTEDFLQQPEFRVSVSSCPTMHNSAHLASNDRHLLSFNRCARISTVM